jgi:DNA primase catalytic core
MPQTDPTTLKARVDLVALVRTHGVTLTRAGREWKGLCPFHEERTPSFHVNPQKQLYHCFGCGAGGDAIEFVMKREALDYPAALAKLQGLAGGNAEGTQPGPSRRPVDPLTPEFQRAVGPVLEYYEKALCNSPQAQGYLKSRGIVGAELLDAFRIGYADGSLLRALPSREAAEGREAYDLLRRSGIVTEHGREFFHGYIVIAVTDENGSILNLCGRNTSPRSKRPPHLYLLPHTGPMNPRALNQDAIVLAESPIDLLSLYASGVRNATCNYGTNGFTERLIPLLVDRGVGRVLIAFDADAPGSAAALRLSERLAEAGIEGMRVLFPEGMDPNDVLVRLGADALRGCVERAGRPPEVETSAVDSPSANGAEAPVADAGDGGIRIEKKSLHVMRGERAYRIDGFYRNLSEVSLSVTLTVSCGSRMHTDRIDLYVSKERERFIARVARKLDVGEEIVESDLDGLLVPLRRMQDEWITQSERPKGERPEIRMSGPEREEALALLRSPDLVSRIRGDFVKCLIVGEETNLLAGYMAATSRLLDRPVHVLFQSSSAAGKTTMMKAILAMMPPESVLYYTTMTRQSLLYMQERDLRHTIVAIEELVGAEYAAHIIKMLKSEGRASSATTIKDPQTGLMKTIDFSVEGPICFFSTTTALYVDEEDYNRDLVCAADESREQTARILSMQRLMRTLEGLDMRRERESVLRVHRNAQRLLRPVPVFNPYARHMTFLDSRHRLRRDHEKYLTIIETIALLHQHQRGMRTRVVEGVTREYIEVTLEDIRLANALASAVLGRGLDDCPPHTRNFLGRAALLADERAKVLGVERGLVRLTARELAEHTGLSMPQVGRHLRKLCELEYAVCWPVRNSRLLEYEILPRGGETEGGSFLPGLIDVSELEERMRGQPAG